MRFDPCNRPLKIQESIGTLIPKVEAHLGVVGVHSLTLSFILGSMKCDSWAHSWLVPLQTFALVASRRLRL